MAVDFRDEGVPLLRLRNIEGAFVDLNGCNYLDPSKVAERWPHFRLRVGDLLISTSASLGRISELTEAAAGSIAYTGIIRFRPREAITRDYLRVWLGSREFMEQAEAFAAGSVIRHFGPSHLRSMWVSVPPLRIQELIGAIGRALDDKIELNRRMAETLEAMARALFQSWFVDFDPVRAKAGGRPTGLPDELAALFPDSLDADGLPAGWFTAALGDLVSVDRATKDPVLLGGTHVDHFSLPAFDAGRRPIREQASGIKSLKLAIEPPVVLFSKLNPETPRVWPVLARTGSPMLASTEFLALRPRSPRASLAFVASLLASNAFRDKAVGMVTGTSKSHQRVQPAALLQSMWIAPPAPVLAVFEEIAAPLLSRADCARRESDTLAALRDTLLPKLISGELRIAATEREVA